MQTLLQTLFLFLLVTQICIAQWYQQGIVVHNKNLYAVQFTDANNGLAVGDSGTVLRTNDGGTSWTPVVTGITDEFYRNVFCGCKQWLGYHWYKK